MQTNTSFDEVGVYSRHFELATVRYSLKIVQRYLKQVVSSHEVILTLLFSFEFTLVIKLISVFFCSHYICDHGSVIVSIVAFATTSFQSCFLLLDIFVKLSLFFNFFIIFCFKEGLNTFDVFGITMFWHIFTQFFEEFLNMVWSISFVESLTHFFCKFEVILF